MSQKSIYEFSGKQLLAKWFSQNAKIALPDTKLVQITPETDWSTLPEKHPWLLTQPLVAKPDQLIKRRGKAGLIKLNASWQQASEWIKERMEKEIAVEGVHGVLDHFIVEPFQPHAQSEEFYVSIISVREGDLVYFYHEGGVDVGDVDEKAVKLLVRIDDTLSAQTVEEKLLVQVAAGAVRTRLAQFIADLFEFYHTMFFSYLEINPLVVSNEHGIVPLDLAAKLDQTAEFEVGEKWGKMEWPAPFGRRATREERYIQSLDEKTGASLKLTVLNPNGRVWTMVAGGGASVVYADTITDLGFGHELSNYGEYSGDPSEALTYEYAKTIIDLMTRTQRPEGKVLIIGGGIANFTNVAETFKGIVRALTGNKDKLIATGVQVWVRRGGPNYQQGLKAMRQCGEHIGVPIHVYGPETHITSVVSYALGLVPPPDVGHHHHAAATTAVAKADVSEAIANPVPTPAPAPAPLTPRSAAAAAATGDGKAAAKEAFSLFSKDTVCAVYGMQPGAVQNMLDFDHVCGRKTPSVSAMIYPFSGNHFQKFYWGASEVLIPVYQKMEEAFRRHPAIDTLVNFASFRSVFQSVTETLQYSQIRTIAIIAEGVPENRTKSIIRQAREKGVVIIGPATVGGIAPGCFRIGNTGGMIDNIISSKLYRPGSVAYVSRSGGMSNELNNIVSRNSDGVCEGVAIGGDRYPGTVFVDHLLRYEANPRVKMLVLLGEVGGVDEYDVCEAIKSGKLTKPLVAWCMGTCASIFAYEVQFGHAGALARGQMETAAAKNAAMRAAGAHVPKSFEDFGSTIRQVYTQLVKQGTIVETAEPDTPTIPMDYSWAQKLGLIRKPTSFITTVSDERGEELVYAGVPISRVFEEDLGVGGVIALLWFKRRLPRYATKFIEMVLMLCADHGAAVAGAHNTIVTTRAGKDLIDSLVAGLMTIGPRFGGAIDGAAQQFSQSYDKGWSPKHFVNEMRNSGELIPGIGHRVKSVQNPDKRVTLLRDYALREFPNTDLLKYALEVEKLTTAKRATLILNVDGCIGTSFVDLLRGSGCFTREEADSFIDNGCLNGLFVLARSIGLIGHYLDQKRLKQPLYRHPWDDISYFDDAQ
eukprot:TRINITY_DN8828_c0_g1_i7.p1 TRINITY_DN8828_c0_g1~~TRINITY_DN8828_c0_g1_i7.p1  ORF type:complete len:1096 (-),score=489.17 TRINITY_DN8828_c0_g1_i7:543-3830(-)